MDLACFIAVCGIGKAGVSFDDTKITGNFARFTNPEFAMPKLSKGHVPKLRRNGLYACVYANGQKYRLGKWDKITDQPTESALKAYGRFVAEWIVAPYSAGRHRESEVSINELITAFLNEKQTVALPSDYRSYNIALTAILRLYDDIPADSFSPKSLKAVRNMFVDRGYSRGYCNKLTSLIRTAFRWGVSEELVKETTYNALRCVEELKAGRTAAPESKKRTAVLDEIIEATLPLLTPTVAAMVRLQRMTAMRPSEVCRMTPGQIDQSGGMWYYCPDKHKGTWRNHDRAIPLGIPEQRLLTPYLTGKGDDDAIFSPITSMQEFHKQQAKLRKSKVSPSQKQRHELSLKRKRQKQYQKFWTSDTYAQSIRNALNAANRKLPKEERIKNWSPYMLRHSAISHIAATEGLDVARAVAGQKTINVTQHYNHSAKKVATDYILKRDRKEKGTEDKNKDIDGKNIAQD